MPIGDAPTRERGTVNAPTMTPWLADPVEHVPELLFPDSVATYAKMRRDPTVKSVLNAYTLPIRRAPWHVDPRGATANAARIVADSLGLPVLGDPPTEGPIHTRWVRWPDHLRAALLDLVYGFMPFEPVYDVTTGTAYLSDLPERMPWSLTEIDVDGRGRLSGVHQMRTGQDDVVIAADLLLWYVHDREGSTWTGTSLLREAFAPWLFKVDALRGQSRTLRRFGTGVPVMEPLPGTNPTAAQILEAQRMASSFRGDSDRAGATTPGFRLRIVGIEGNIPDHLPWLRYLDEQIARSTLTSVLDLGSTTNGSRALGTVFLDLLVQAMQAVAEEHASIASTLARRLTDFNEGEAAEAPIIVVGDVGSSRQTLALTVAELVKAGAVVVDTALEAWVRDAFDLPATSGTPAAPAAPPLAVAPATPAPAVAAAQGTPFRRDRARQETWPYRRELTATEIAAALDPLALDATVEGLVAAFLTDWGELSAVQAEALTAAVGDALTAGDLTTLAGYTAPYDDVATALAAVGDRAHAAGVDAAKAEARAQGIEVAADLGADLAVRSGQIDAMSSTAAASMSMSLTSGAMREAMRLAGDGTATGDVTGGVRAYLDSLTGSLAREVATGVVNAAVNEGRSAVMAGSLGPARYFASEVRDVNTCGPCLEVDGKEYASLADAEAAYPTGGFVDCQGRLRCRGIIFASYGEDA